MPLLEEKVARSDGMVVKNNVDVPSLFPFSKSVGAIIGRPYETLAVLQYKTTQKRRPTAALRNIYYIAKGDQ